MKIETLEIAGFKSAIKSMRNPKNSWNRTDSFSCMECNDELMNCECYECKHYNDLTNFILGKEDLKLAQTLIKGGKEHSKYLRQIQVWADFDMPRYFWSEFDTYKFNTKNSCSTMHKLLNKENPITLDMFVICNEDVELLNIIIDRLNDIREEYLNAKNQKTKDYLLLRAKRILPEGLLQLRTVNTNYAEIRNMWLQRVDIPHRLKEEWVKTFGEWVLSLPYSKELITFECK